MPASWVEVANSALIKLGAQTIVSLDEGIPEAEYCKERLFPCRDITLRRHAWTCAQKRVILAPIIEVPPFGYSALFQLPSDYIHLTDIEKVRDYRIVEQNRIAANAQQLDITYTRRIDNPAELDPLLADAIACCLASDIAMLVTQSPQIKANAMREFEMSLRTARHNDSRADGKRRLDLGWITAVRNSNRGF